jgi:DNA-binding transcriptional LysR family regulator
MGAAMPWTDRIGRRLNLRDLHILLAVAKSGSMGKAAAELAISQPSVSKAIAAVEHAVGLRLLDRGAHGVEPTIYGRALLKCGVAVFDELRQGVGALDFLADAGTGELRIGCSESLAAGFISVVVDRLSRRYPRAVFNVIPADPTALIDRELRQRNIEAAITWIPRPYPPDDVEVEVLFADRLILMASSSSKWARRRKIVWEDLLDEAWVLPPPDSAFGTYITEQIRAAGLQPPQAKVVSFSIPLHHRMLATGRFVTLLAVSILQFTGNLPLKALSLESPVPPRPVGIMTLKGRTLSPLALAFIECAWQVARPLARDSHLISR